MFAVIRLPNVEGMRWDDVAEVARNVARELHSKKERWVRYKRGIWHHLDDISLSQKEKIIGKPAKAFVPFVPLLWKFLANASYAATWCCDMEDARVSP